MIRSATIIKVVAEEEVLPRLGKNQPRMVDHPPHRGDLKFPGLLPHLQVRLHLHHLTDQLLLLRDLRPGRVGHHGQIGSLDEGSQELGDTA